MTIGSGRLTTWGKPPQGQTQVQHGKFKKIQKELDFEAQQTRLETKQ